MAAGEERSEETNEKKWHEEGERTLGRAKKKKEEKKRENTFSPFFPTPFFFFFFFFARSPFPNHC